MNNNTIQYLRNGCTYFGEILDLTTDGNGQNLHDIKYTFDYVIRYVREKDLETTAAGNKIISDAEKAGQIISAFWREIDSLKTSVERFCDNQESINRQGY